jgi:twitching motility protein PilT
MRRHYFEGILRSLLDSHPNISDLLFSVGRPLQVDSDGELRAVEALPGLTRLTAYQTEKIALTIIGDNLRLLRELLTRGSCDCSYSLGDEMRFRVNIFRQRGRFGIVMRRTQAVMPTLETLELPPVFREICMEKNGLVLVTGATSSGKTTTLSAILEEINSSQAVHVITLEDPIEFVHDHKRATFTQREYGTDFDSYAEGLRSALRQAPKVILVGEMRDRETVEIALTAAETGHLVLSTLQTINAGQAINRILGMFDLSEQALLRLRLMETLRWVVSQRLVPRVGGGRQLIQEIMGSNLRVRETIALGESDGRNYFDITEASSTYGWVTFDQSLAIACVEGHITEETALLYATHRNKLTRLLDDSRKRRGEEDERGMDLRLDTRPKPSATPPPIRLSA